MALPVELPARYEPAWAYESRTDSAGNVVSRVASFAQPDETSVERGVTLCVTDHPDHCMGGMLGNIERRVGPVRVVIFFRRTWADHPAWQQVDFTTDLDEVQWLH